MLTRRRLFVSIGSAGVVAVGSLIAFHAFSPAEANTTTPSAVASNPPVPTAVDVPREALANMDLHFANAELRPLMRSVQATGVVSFDARHLAQVSSPSRGRIISNTGSLRLWWKESGWYATASSIRPEPIRGRRPVYQRA